MSKIIYDGVNPEPKYVIDIPAETFFTGKIAAYPYRLFKKSGGKVYPIDSNLSEEIYWASNCAIENYMEVDIIVRPVAP